MSTHPYFNKIPVKHSFAQTICTVGGSQRDALGKGTLINVDPMGTKLALQKRVRQIESGQSDRARDRHRRVLRPIARGGTKTAVIPMCSL